MYITFDVASPLCLSLRTGVVFCFKGDLLIKVDTQFVNLPFLELFQCVLMLWVKLEYCRGACSPCYRSVW